MPQILLVVAVGVAFLLVRRWMRRQQEQVAADLRDAREAMEAMEQKKVDHAVPLEQDPATGVYRPKR